MLDFFFGITDTAKSSTSFFDVSMSLEPPSWCRRECGKNAEHSKGDEELEYDNCLPVPFTNTGLVLAASVGNPEADE